MVNNQSMLVRSFALVLLVVLSLQAQAQTRFLRRGINPPRYDHLAPAVSGDGQSMVYLSTYSTTGELELRYTWKENGDWVEPIPMPLVHEAKVNYQGGFSLNYDGTKFYFTSARANGIGNFDIWYSERSGRDWRKPRNLGKPVNSGTSEGYPSVSPDGRWLYFVRCGGMLATKCVECEMYRAQHRKEEYWNEPERLPAPLNVGHVTSPRLMPDNRTLIFASDRPGGKGGLDTYWSRFDDGQWSQPVAMDFLNTEKDDENVSIPAPGNYAFASFSFQGFWRLTQYLIPQEHRPLNILQVSGTVRDENGQPIDAGIQVYDATLQQQDQFVRTGEDGNGNFILTIPEGKVWDFSILSADTRRVFYSERFDTRTLDQPQRVVRNVDLGLATPGTRILLPNITLDSVTLKGLPGSELEARRLIRMMQGAKVRVRVLAVVPPLPPPPPMPDSLVWVQDSTAMDHADSISEVDTVFQWERAIGENTFVEPAPTQADMDLIGWNRAQALIDFMREQGVPERFMEKGVLSWEDARRLAPDMTEERLRELVVVEIIP